MITRRHAKTSSHFYQMAFGPWNRERPWCCQRSFWNENPQTNSYTSVPMCPGKPCYHPTVARVFGARGPLACSQVWCSQVLALRFCNSPSNIPRPVYGTLVKVCNGDSSTDLSTAFCNFGAPILCGKRSLEGATLMFCTSIRCKWTWESTWFNAIVMRLTARLTDRQRVLSVSAICKLPKSRRPDRAQRQNYVDLT